MTRPIRVLELRTVRGTGGGPEKTILLGAKQADPSRFAITICYLRNRDDREFGIDARAKELGLDYAEIVESHAFDPRILIRLKRLVRERGIDIVHAHDYKTDVLAWFLSDPNHVKILSTVHGWFGSETARERLYYSIDKAVLRRFPTVVAVSSPLKGELIRTGSRSDRITVLPNGIDEAAFKRDPGRRPRIRAALGLADDEIVIGAVGRLERQKRFDLLMSVVAGLRPRHPRLRLLVAGSGGLAAELEVLRHQLFLDDACVLLGHRTDVIDLHHAFDLFVQASDEEGSPNVVLEAMAMETPLVATNVGGTEDLVSDGVHGLLVPPGSPDRLALAVSRALSDGVSGARRAAAARHRVETELSFGQRMARLEDIYRRIVAPIAGRKASD